ncbi:hypothetical protein MKK70_20940 [Methylobacterium sp. E-041]|uniref:hypothetical protein n=1 Tax=Methylobacterium sp. E-041 TaxID=2836573 RepID=UPI001FBBD104|nr:hypothetical protein [Methylobacterium sp. E-041]MCJ2107798.1 hypothetical protein [Methylobacterium sp. E-041]
MRRRRGRGFVALGIVLGFLGGLGACESAVQRQRLSICRKAVPALVPDETAVRILRAGTGAAPDSIRVDYVLGHYPHYALCRFNAGAVLDGISTDRTTLSEASLYLLKRYYLDTPDADEPKQKIP